MTTAPETVNKNLITRNYQLDFLKLIFASWVFMVHARIFVNENTRFRLPIQSGGFSVHFFFIVSGMLMANSVMKSEPDKESAGKCSISFVLGKFKNIAWEYFSAFIICVTIYIIMILLRHFVVYFLKYFCCPSPD